MMFALCDHPDPRPAVRRRCRGLRYEGRFIGYVSLDPQQRVICNLIVNVDDWTLSELTAFLNAELGAVARVSQPPRLPLQTGAMPTDEREKKGFFGRVWDGIWGHADRW